VAFDRTRRGDWRATERTADGPRRRGAGARVGRLARRAPSARALRALQALTDTALSHLSLDALLPELLERVRAVMRVDNVAILLLDEEARELEVSAARGPEEEVVGRVRIPVGVGFAGRIAATRAPLAVADLSSYPVSNPLLRGRLRSALGVPLLAAERVLGVVHIGTTTPREFTADEAALLGQAADRIARAIERTQLFAAVEVARQVAERRTAFLNTTLAALGDGLVITDTEGRVLYGNPAFAALLGVPPIETTGDGDVALPAALTERLRVLEVRDLNGKPLAPDELALARALRGETLAGPTALEVQFRRLDGQDAIVSASGAPVRDPQGRLIGAVMALRDVTERRRLEGRARAATSQARERAERLEAIFAAVTDGLFVYDAAGRIVERNPAAAAMLAALAPPGSLDESVYERGRRIAGGLRDIAGRPLPEAEWPQARIARGEVLSGQSAVDIRLRANDGRDVSLSVSGAPLRDEHGALAGSVCLYRDVNERLELTETLRQRTRELEEANRSLRALLDVLPVGVAFVDATGKPLLVNDAVRAIWGQDLPMAESAAEYGEYRAWRVDTGERVAADEWSLARALSDGAVSVGREYDIEAFDGQRKTILDSAAPLRDASGAISGAVSVIFDITERRQLERRRRDALDAFIAITRAMVEATGDDEDLDTADAVVPPLAGDDADTRGRHAVAHRLAVLARGILGCGRVSISAVEGDPPRSRPVAMVGFSPEQARLWRREQSERQPLEFGAGLIPDDRERLLGGDVLTLDLTRPPYKIPNNYGVTAVLAAPMRTQGRLVGLLGLDFQDPGNQPHRFTAEEIQIAEAVARLGAVVLEHERLLREREAARAEALALADANRRMDEFLGIAGHELRTPVTAFKANLQIAERRTRQALQANGRAAAGAPSERNESGSAARELLAPLLHLLERARLAAERQERLVEDLLDVSRISSGQLEYRMAPIDLTALVRETVEERRLGAPGRRIELKTPAAPVMVTADADRIGQVLTNYVTNAAKYSEGDRPIVVTLRVRGTPARVEVRDQGPGLAPEQRRHLFERFYRVPGMTVMNGSGVGLGLGLYISKTIVERHGGEVGVESAPGEGSTFWFALPLAGAELGG
jgi:PAS domain S-box-containing protein